MQLGSSTKAKLELIQPEGLLSHQDTPDEPLWSKQGIAESEALRRSVGTFKSFAVSRYGQTLLQSSDSVQELQHYMSLMFCLYAIYNRGEVRKWLDDQMLAFSGSRNYKSTNMGGNAEEKVMLEQFHEKHGRKEAINVCFRDGGRHVRDKAALSSALAIDAPHRTLSWFRYLTADAEEPGADDSSGEPLGEDVGLSARSGMAITQKRSCVDSTSR